MIRLSEAYWTLSYTCFPCAETAFGCDDHWEDVLDRVDPTFEDELRRLNETPAIRLY